ncbi:hypothetical protein KSP39_PZI003253 [Platanthera zijinensis]|uniref:Uncharacterized protein n=1 Tax=Platanthera zijinensis TaxID=2320716 RepID=A0AAP0BV99_9ASPA
MDASPQAVVVAYKISAASGAERKVQAFHTLTATNKKNSKPATMLGISATLAIAFLLVVAGRGRSPDDTVAEPPEASLLCVSKCSTCPAVCSLPKSPGGVILSPPTKKSPPAPSSLSSSYPYYYFYTAGADRSHGLVFGFLCLLPLLVLSFVAEANR